MWFALAASRRRRVAVLMTGGIVLALLVAAAGCTDPVRSKPVADTRDTVHHPDAYVSSGRTTDPHLRLPPTGFARPYPLVVALHSLYHTGAEAEAEMGLDALAANAGFAVVYPDGKGESWNAGSCCGTAATSGVDDVEWLRSLISDLEQHYPIDRRRVILVGLSNGGMLAYRYACEHADELAGIAVVAGSLQVSACRPAVPVEVVAIHGLADEHVPYEGVAWSEALQSPITSAIQSLAPFRAAALCELPSQLDHIELTGTEGLPITIPPAASRAGPAGSRASVTTGPPTGSAPPATPDYVAVKRQAPCVTGTPVIEYVLPRADHGWPASTGPYAFDTAGVIWRTLSPARSQIPGPLY